MEMQEEQPVGDDHAAPLAPGSSRVHGSTKVARGDRHKMHFDGGFRHIGTVDVAPLARIVDSFGEDAWNEYVRRQERFEPHRHTHTVPLLFDEDMRHSDPTPWPRFAEIEAALEPSLRLIREATRPDTGRLDEGYFVRIILTRLRPGAVISPHRDRGDAVKRSHRNHIAITTNPGVDFAIDGEIKHFAPGEIWEINNRKYHAVRNLGDEPRVHLILDYVVPGEEVQDPDGLVIC
jgi:hypothetical protein